MTVPAKPQSTCAGPVSGPGVTRQLPSGSSRTPVPRARSAAAISSLSRDLNGATSIEGAVACAARMRARLVIDLDPGTGTVADTGPSTVGAAQPVSAVVTTSTLPRRRAERRGVGSRCQSMRACHHDPASGNPGWTEVTAPGAQIDYDVGHSDDIGFGTWLLLAWVRPR